MERRDFLKGMLGGGALAGAPPYSNFPFAGRSAAAGPDAIADRGTTP